jgi:vacuolar-type H+-ATPase subunit I/STV1
MDINVEQPKSRDELLDEQLASADQPEVAEPVVSTPAEPVAEVTPEEPAETPKSPVELDAVLKEKEELAKKVEDLTKERDGLVGRVKHIRGKSREHRETVLRQLQDAQKRLEEVESRQAKAEDPLKTWRADPENEGIAPTDEVLQAHDAFLLHQAEAQRAKPQDVKTAAAQVDAAMLKVSPNEQLIVQAAVDRRFITEADVLAMANSANPAQAAVSIARERFEELGTDQELDLLSRLFPQEKTPEPPVLATPKATVSQKAAAPKPKETTNEADYEPDGFGPNHRAIAQMFFR